ncbi:MAG: AMP-binding protein, partial [Acidimicrobiales bacterium]
MRVPLCIGDFLERAELVYGDRRAVVDEPGGPGGWDRLTYSQLAARARGMAIALDRMEVEAGERVALVSPNSARFLASFFGVSGYGRVLVPINFRLNADEVAYIVEHSGARVLLVDPELDEPLAAVTA